MPIPSTPMPFQRKVRSISKFSAILLVLRRSFIGRYSDAVAIALGICVPLAFVAFLAAAVVFMRKYNWGPFVKRARKAGAKQVEDKISIAESLPEKS